MLLRKQDLVWVFLVFVWASFFVGVENSRVQLFLEDWEYQIIGSGVRKPTKVPTTLTKNLQDQGIIKQPYYRDEFLKFYAYETKDVLYRTMIPPNFINLCSTKQYMRMVFYGLDTHCDVYLNSQKLFSAHNMYREYKYDIKKFEAGDSNQLSVRCNSSANFDMQQEKLFKEQFGFSLPQNFSFSRKAAYQYGWDWGPRILTVGIWKPVKIQCFDGLSIGRISLKYPTITYTNQSLSDIYVVSDLTHLKPLTNYTATISFSQFSKELYNNKFNFISSSDTSYRATLGPISLNSDIAKNMIWWTWDIGNPNLFNLTVTIQGAQARIRTGFRTVKIKQDKDATGNGTSFIVNLNGYDLFMRGGNYIPPAMEMSDLKALKIKYQEVREQSLFAKFNMIRVWGGGHYEHDAFYEQMDEAGILIWHDLMFACALYPIFGDVSTAQNIQEQMKDNIGRIGTHPSIALWNGNNEVWIGWQEWGWQSGLTQTQKNQAQSMYSQIFKISIPKIISDLTPDIFYWETSPSSSSNSLSTIVSGDIHFWRVWGAGTPIDEYQSYTGRFNSEYGMQSMPEYSSIIKYTNESDRAINSYILRLHERHPKGDQYLPMYTESVCAKTTDLKRYSYFSQVMQAYSLQMAIRSLRGKKPYCMGSLYWQLNDVWPVSSWASVDYYGSYKASHYWIRQSYSMIYCNAYYDTTNQNYIIFLVNQLLQKQQIFITVTFTDTNGTVIKSSSYQKNVTGLDSITIDRFPKYQIEPEMNRTFINIEAYVIGHGRYQYNFFFVSPKNLLLYPPQLSYHFEGQQIIKISCKSVAIYVWIRSKTNKALNLPQNYFHVIPGIQKSVILPPGTIISDIEVTSYYDQVIKSQHQREKAYKNMHIDDI